MKPPNLYPNRFTAREHRLGPPQAMRAQRIFYDFMDIATNYTLLHVDS